MRRETTPLMGLTIVLLPFLAACSHTPRPADAARPETHEAAQRQVEELYEQTLDLVGDGWIVGSEEWNECGRSALTGTDSWHRFSQRMGPLARSSSDIADEVAVLWNRLGYPVEVVSDETLSPPRKVVSYPRYLSGTTAEGFGVVFTVGEAYADFSAASRCVPSDPTLVDRYPS
jgi:hypothetical protein